MAHIPSRQYALEAAQKAIVLLKNDAGVLPLDPNSKVKIAVIGPNVCIYKPMLLILSYCN